MHTTRLSCGALLAVLTPLSLAQDAAPNGANRISFDDGGGDNLWKVAGPSGPSDWFNVDFDGALDNAFVIQLHCDSGDTAGIPGQHAELGLYPEGSAFPNTPDLANPIVNRASIAMNASDVAGTDSAYLVTKTTVPAGDHHVALRFQPGDSHTWCAADTNGTLNNRSYFTATNYSTGALPFSVNWMLAAGAYDDTTPGTLLINGSTSASVEQDGGGLCLTFFGPTLNTASILYLCIAGNPALQLLPAGFTVTDGVFAGPCPMTWQICSAFDCNTPTGTGIELCTIYFDGNDLKPNGKPKTKVGTSATLDLIASTSCIPTGGAGDCFGVRDDCILDSTIWIISNPAGPSDWFNVNHGTTAGSSTTVNTLTGLSVSSWDFCGFGPFWAEVGIYPADTSLDATGRTPDVNNPITAIGGSSARMAPGAADWGCPLTFYDTPDVPANSTTAYHGAVRWPASDSCIWIGSDTDGTDNKCGTPIPNNGGTSLFSTTGYGSPAVPFSTANWMIQIDWQ